MAWPGFEFAVCINDSCRRGKSDGAKSDVQNAKALAPRDDVFQESSKSGAQGDVNSRFV